MRIFIDTVETITSNSNLDSSLISIGAVAENGDTFYGEFTDYIEAGIPSHMLKIYRENLPLSDISERALTNYFDPRYPEVRGNTPYIMIHLVNWLNSFGSVEMWVDYELNDKVRLALRDDPSFICESAPFNLHTALRVKEHSPEVDREILVEVNNGMPYRDYDALYRAQALKDCYDALFGEKEVEKF